MIQLKKRSFGHGKGLRSDLSLARIMVPLLILIAVSLQVQSHPRFKKVRHDIDNTKSDIKNRTTFAADTTIRGTITDSVDSPLAGASVVVKGTKNGTLTNASGGFTLQGVAPNATLVVSIIGYKTREVKLSRGETNVSIRL